MAAAREVLHPQRLTRHREPRGLEGPPGSVHPMGHPRWGPLLAAPRHPRLMASAAPSDPCETSTQRTDKAEQTNGPPRPATRVRDPLTTGAQWLPLRLALRLALSSHPRDPWTTTSVGFLRLGLLPELSPMGFIAFTRCTFLSNRVAQKPHLVYAPRPFNHRASLAVAIRGRLGSCQHRFTLTPRPIGALSRRASSTMVQTLVHPDR